VLDRQALIEPATVAAYARLGWIATAQVEDMRDWATAMTKSGYSAQPLQRRDLIVANLFLHHFG